MHVDYLPGCLYTVKILIEKFSRSIPEPIGPPDSRKFSLRIFAYLAKAGLYRDSGLPVYGIARKRDPDNPNKHKEKSGSPERFIRPAKITGLWWWC